MEDHHIRYIEVTQMEEETAVIPADESSPKKEKISLAHTAEPLS